MFAVAVLTCHSQKKKSARTHLDFDRDGKEFAQTGMAGFGAFEQ